MSTLKLLHLGICLIVSLYGNAQEVNSTDLSVLEGVWKLDMSPENVTDANFAKMTISKASDKGLQGEFYRDGVKIREGHINTQLGIIHAALISGDNSGTYNTSFYYKDGKLYGTTHSLERDFLAVWTAIKE